MRRRPDELEVVGGGFDVKIQRAALVVDGSTVVGRSFNLCVSLGRIEMIVWSIVKLASPNPESTRSPTSRDFLTLPVNKFHSNNTFKR